MIQREPPPAGPADLAALGRLAAQHGRLDDLLRDACQRVVQGLGVSHAKVLEYQPGEKTLLVRAGIGWAASVVGNARLESDLGSPAGYALQTGQPTIANDLANEARFRVPALLREQGIRSAVNVIIRFGDAVYGVLEADSRAPRAFDERDIRFLQGFADLLALAVAQQESRVRQAQLTRQLDVALHELQHRTRNNNQMLLSIIRLTQRRHALLETREVLEELATRVDALSRVDHAILSSGDPSVIDLGRYALGIIQNLVTAHEGRAATIRLDTRVSEVAIDGRRAQALGLIVNEFVTNSFKHAFRQNDASVLGVEIAVDEATVRLALWDDGPGFDRDAATGLGTTLIDAMVADLAADVRWTTDAGGTRLELAFPQSAIPPQPEAGSSVAAP